MQTKRTTALKVKAGPCAGGRCTYYIALFQGNQHFSPANDCCHMVANSSLGPHDRVNQHNFNFDSQVDACHAN